MIVLKRTNSEDIDFINLVAELDEYLKRVDGDDHSFYDQFNKIDTIKYALVVYQDKKPIGCGAIKKYSSDSMEVKRMYVCPNGRSKGIGSKILKGLESWTKELSYTKCILETGEKQMEAIQLYLKNKYKKVSNYGQYRGVENSICFEKQV